MKKTLLPDDSKTYTKLAFREKEKWHQKRAKMSLTKKIESLDRMLEMRKHIPRFPAASVKDKAQPLSSPYRTFAGWFPKASPN